MTALLVSASISEVRLGATEVSTGSGVDSASGWESVVVHGTSPKFGLKTPAAVV